MTGVVAWVRHAWSVATDPSGAAESADLVTALTERAEEVAS